MSDAIKGVLGQLTQLVKDRMFAKAEEVRAIAYRRSLDRQIVELFNAVNLMKTEGSVSERIDGFAKIEVDQPIERKVADPDALRQIWNHLSRDQLEVFRWKPEINVAAMKQLQASNPAEFGMIAYLIESKPQTPAVTVTNLQEPGAQA